MDLSASNSFWKWFALIFHLVLLKMQKKNYDPFHWEKIINHTTLNSYIFDNHTDYMYSTDMNNLKNVASIPH